MDDGTSVDALKRRLVTAQDISQLRACFYAMEEVAQKSLAVKNKHIDNLVRDNDQLRRQLQACDDQLQRALDELERAKELLRTPTSGAASLPALSSEYSLPDLIAHRQNLDRVDNQAREDQISQLAHQNELLSRDNADLARDVAAVKERIQRSLPPGHAAAASLASSSAPSALGATPASASASQSVGDLLEALDRAHQDELRQRDDILEKLDAHMNEKEKELSDATARLGEATGRPTYTLPQLVDHVCEPGRLGDIEAERRKVRDLEDQLRAMEDELMGRLNDHRARRGGAPLPTSSGAPPRRGAPPGRSASYMSDPSYAPDALGAGAPPPRRASSSYGGGFADDEFGFGEPGSRGFARGGGGAPDAYGSSRGGGYDPDHYFESGGAVPPHGYGASRRSGSGGAGRLPSLLEETLAEQEAEIRALEDELRRRPQVDERLWDEVKNVVAGQPPAALSRGAPRASMRGAPPMAAANIRDDDVPRLLLDRLAEKDDLIQQLDGRLEQLEREAAQLRDVELEAREKDAQLDEAERLLRSKDDHIVGLERELDDIGQDSGVLDEISHHAVQARDRFETHDNVIDDLISRLKRIEEERRSKEELVRRFQSSQLSFMEDRARHAPADDEPRMSMSSRHSTTEEQELQELFKSARRTINSLGQKAEFQMAALYTKEELDRLYNEELTVTAGEILLREEQLGLLTEKVAVADEFIAYILSLLGRAPPAPAPRRTRSLYVPRTRAAPAPAPVPAPAPSHRGLSALLSYRHQVPTAGGYHPHPASFAPVPPPAVAPTPAPVASPPRPRPSSPLVQERDEDSVPPVMSPIREIRSAAPEAAMVQTKSPAPAFSPVALSRSSAPAPAPMSNSRSMGAPRRVDDNNLDVRIEGTPMEGERLVCVGEFVNRDPESVSFTWSRRAQDRSDYVVIPRATNRFYMPTAADVNHDLECLARRFHEDGGETRRTAYTGTVKLGNPKIVELNIEGGPHHTAPLVLRHAYVGGREGSSRIQWYRSEFNEPFRAIAGATGPTYQPTADDLHVKLRVEYTPVRSDGVRGTTVSFDVPASMLEKDPAVTQVVERNVKSGQATFEVQALASGESRTIIATERGIRIKRGQRTRFKEDYSSDFKVILSPRDLTSFTIATGNQVFYDFGVANAAQRDIIAVTVRSFANMALERTRRGGLRKVASLTKLRSEY